MSSLTHEQLVDIANQLRNIIPQLFSGEVECAEYGDCKSPKFSGVFRARYMNTAGGAQYRLTQVILGRGESTLGYFRHPEDMVCEMITQVVKYHAPSENPVIRKYHESVKATRPQVKLEWFARDEPDEHHMQAPDIIPGINPNDVVTITLGEPK